VGGSQKGYKAKGPGHRFRLWGRKVDEKHAKSHKNMPFSKVSKFGDIRHALDMTFIQGIMPSKFKK
jgi:hypothetical protein